jgi:hypothetical protein
MEIKKLISRTDYLLPEKLEGLHAQSSQWLETIAFWKDETRFFSNVLRGRQAEGISAGSILPLLENLEHLHQLLYDYLSEEILSHERMLSRILKGDPGIADAQYRDAHRKLADRMYDFDNDFRLLKQSVFEQARSWK